MPLEFYCGNPECGGVAFQWSGEDMNPDCKKRNWCCLKCCPLPKEKRMSCGNYRMYLSVHPKPKPKDNLNKRKIHMSF